MTIDQTQDVCVFQFSEQQAILVQTLIARCLNSGIVPHEGFSDLGVLDFREPVIVTDFQRYTLRFFLISCLAAINQSKPEDKVAAINQANPEDKSPVKSFEKQVAVLESAIALIEAETDDLMKFMCDSIQEDETAALNSPAMDWAEDRLHQMDEII